MGDSNVTYLLDKVTFLSEPHKTGFSYGGDFRLLLTPMAVRQTIEETPLFSLGDDSNGE